MHPPETKRIWVSWNMLFFLVCWQTCSSEVHRPLWKWSWGVKSLSTCSDVQREDAASNILILWPLRSGSCWLWPDKSRSQVVQICYSGDQCWDTGTLGLDTAVRALMYFARLRSDLPKRVEILPCICICRHGLLCTDLDVTQKKDETDTFVG